VTALFRALVWGHLRANRLRAAMTVVAVALGVAIALAISLANGTAIASFASSVNVITNHVNLQVLGVGRGFDERTLLRVEDVPGVRYAGPAIEDSITVGARAGDPTSGEILRVLGVDLLRPVPGAEGGIVTPGNVAVADPWLVVNGRGAFVGARVAATYGWHVGSVFAAQAGARTEHLRVAGIVPAGTAGLDSSVVFVDIATAQELFGKVGVLDRIDCVVDPARLAAATAAIRAILPPGTRAIEPAVRTGEIRRMLRSFELNLAALAYIALLVGMYLIYNTVAISVVQRRPEIGTLRALGARRRTICAIFLAEGALYGIVGGIAGCGLGALLASFSVAAVSRTVDTLYVASHADRVAYEPMAFVQTFLVGIAAAILSALVPALEAAATPPATAMRAAGFERRPPRLVARTAIAGALALVAGYACTLAPPIDDVPAFGYLAGLAVIFGGSLFAPAGVAGIARLAAATFGQRWAAARLAAANLAASPVRISVAVASLTIAIAMMIAVAILIGSFRTTVIAWANDTLTADLFVQPFGSGDASFDARMPISLVARLARVPGVANADTFRGITIPLAGRLTTLGATDTASLARRNRLRFLGRVDVAALERTLPGSMQALISEPFATKFHLGVGDGFPVDTPAGRVTFRVAAVYNDYSSDAGMAIVDERTFVRLFHDDSINSVAIVARPGTDLAALRSALVRAVLPQRITVQTNRELRALVIRIFDRTFAITYALYIISIAIAVLGVVTTLFALVLERRREIGILRYLGLRRREVRSMVLIEAGFIGLLGGLGGIVVGALLALLLIFVINRQAFGWLIELHVPYDFLAEALVLVIVAAVIAGIYPAGVAARIRTAEAVREE
jgi:putative ABC transport system permease protein